LLIPQGLTNPIKVVTMLLRVLDAELPNFCDDGIFTHNLRSSLFG